MKFCVSVKQAPHSEKATGHGMHCREILFIRHCSPRAREFPRSVNCSLQRTVAELRSVEVARFSDFGLFSNSKCLKCTFRWSAYSTAVTLQNDSDFSMWWSNVQRGAFQHRRLPATSGRGAGDPQTYPNFDLWQMAIPTQNATACHVRSRPKMSENAQFWGQMYFPTKHLRPYPQNHPKPILVDLSMQNLLYRELSVSRTLMELQSWNFTVI